MRGGTVLIHVLANVVARITPGNAQSSPLPDPHVSGERGLASLGERVKIDRSYHELGKISLSWAALIVSSLYKLDAQARESSKAAAHPSLARRACMSSLLAFR